MESIEQYKVKIAEIKKQDIDNSVNVDLLQYGVSEEYYQKVVETVEMLVDFENKYLHTDSLKSALAEAIGVVEDEDIKLCVLIDAMRCYDGLDHPTSFTTPEGVALLVLIGGIYGIGCIKEYEDLKEVNSSTLSLIDITPYIDGCSIELGNKTTLFLSTLLEKEDVKIDTLYRMLIYNLCKKIAEVDGDISISEKEWLEEIARLDDEDMSNDIDMSVF